MGYVRQKTVKIAFGEGHEFAGLEVRMRKVSVGKFLRLLPKIDLLDNLSSVSTPEDIEQLEDVFRDLSKMLVSWNLEDEEEDEDGKKTGVVIPVPATFEGLMDQELRLVNALVQEWAAHVGGVPAPLGEPSSSGVPSLEVSLPMETLSASLPS